MTTMIKAFGLCGLNALTTVVIRVRLQWRTREGPKLKWNIAAQGTSKFTVNIGLCLVGCISCTLNFIGHLPHQSHRHTCWMVFHFLIVDLKIDQTGRLVKEMVT